MKTSLRAPALLCVIMTALRPPVQAQKQSSRRPLLSYVQVGPYRLGFSDDTLLERGRHTIVKSTSIDEARHLLGPSGAHQTGDAASSLNSICYRLSGTPRMVLMYDRAQDKRTRRKDGSIQSYTEWARLEVQFRNGIVVGFRGTRIDAS